MKKAFGVLELLIVVVIAIIVYFTCFNHGYGRSNPFDDNAKVNNQKELIDEKIQKIEDTKLLKNQIEENLRKGY
ncbi:hypothetical protein HDR58_02665 [bacterium]|nr:hypothetical protein [bacterium]